MMCRVTLNFWQFILVLFLLFICRLRCVMHMLFATLQICCIHGHIILYCLFLYLKNAPRRKSLEIFAFHKILCVSPRFFYCLSLCCFLFMLFYAVSPTYAASLMSFIFYDVSCFPTSRHCLSRHPCHQEFVAVYLICSSPRFKYAADAVQIHTIHGHKIVWSILCTQAIGNIRSLSYCSSPSFKYTGDAVHAHTIHWHTKTQHSGDTKAQIEHISNPKATPQFTCISSG